MSFDSSFSASPPFDALQDLGLREPRNLQGAAIHRDALAGLTGHPKSLPSKYLYDEVGSRLFEDICGLAEYHVTRTEIALLTHRADEIAAGIPAGAALVEFGSGASVKTRLLIEAATGIGCYVPIDISPSALDDAVTRLHRSWPGLPIMPLVADFTAPVSLPPEVGRRPVVGFFPGSTIGNFERDAAVDFLKSARRLLGPRSVLLLGADLTRHRPLLEKAYDDAAGVTAAFNLNLLTRLNRECGADFDLARFAHRAIWNAQASRIEMHLESLVSQTVRVAGKTIFFRAGETIHTESSHKYRGIDIASIASRAGWRIDRAWTGTDPQFPKTKGDTGCFGLFRLI